MATEVDHLMEVSAGYLALSTAAAPREGEAMMEGDRSDTDSPEMERRLIKGVKTGAGITIQLEACGDMKVTRENSSESSV